MRNHRHPNRRLVPAATALAVLALVVACGGGELSPPPVSGSCVRMPAEATLADPAGGSSEWNDVLIDWRSRVWLAGYDRGSVGQTTLDPSGDARAVVQVRAPDGGVLFSALGALDSPGTDVAEALAMDSRGLVYVAGRTTGVLAGDGNRGQFDHFIARGDATQPAAAWRVAQFGDEYPQHVRRIALRGDGELTMAGYNDDYIPTNYVAAWADAFVARLRVTAGTAGPPVALEWNRQSDTLEQDYGAALAVLASGDAYLGGAVSTGARRGMYVRKVRPDGSVEWWQRYTTGGADNVAALFDLGDGSLLMAGSVFGSFRAGTDHGEQDLFVARIRASDGTVLWSTQLGTAAADWLTDAKVDAYGNVFLFGETEGTFVVGRPSSGLNDLFLLKLSPSGAVLRAWQWGTSADERSSRIALDACGRALAVGSVSSPNSRRAVVWFPQDQ